jgi:hypothetical protein
MRSLPGPEMIRPGFARNARYANLREVIVALKGFQ